MQHSRAPGPLPDRRAPVISTGPPPLFGTEPRAILMLETKFHSHIKQELFLQKNLKTSDETWLACWMEMVYRICRECEVTTVWSGILLIRRSAVSGPVHLTTL